VAHALLQIEGETGTPEGRRREPVCPCVGGQRTWRRVGSPGTCRNPSAAGRPHASSAPSSPRPPGGRRAHPRHRPGRRPGDASHALCVVRRAASASLL